MAAKLKVGDKVLVAMDSVSGRIDGRVAALVDGGRVDVEVLQVVGSAGETKRTLVPGVLVVDYAEPGTLTMGTVCSIEGFGRVAVMLPPAAAARGAVGAVAKGDEK